MGRFFSTDSILYRIATRFFYSAWLNILWFVCSIPIFTIGASTTALYYVTSKVVKDAEGNITKQFFVAFKENFKKSTIVWLILLGIGIVLGVDGYVLYHMYTENAFWTLCTAAIIALSIVYVIILMNIFPLMARFENTVKATFINAFLMGVRYLFSSILMFLVYFVMLFVTINLFIPIIVFGEGLCALLCSHILKGVLEKIEANQEKINEEAC
jgi:uncharacterized membrane protein YesL